MAQSIDIDINLVTRQANANARALEQSTLGLSAKFTGLLAAVELASRAFGALSSVYSSTVGSAVELQAAVAEVTTLVGDQVGVQQQLEQQVLQLQRAYGGEQGTIAKAFYDAISSGAVDASDAVGLLDTANRLAVGGVTDINTAVNGLTTVLNSYGLESSRSLDVSDALFAAMK